MFILSHITVKPAHVVTFIKQSLVLIGHIFLVVIENELKLFRNSLKDTVKPVLRGHLWKKKKWSSKTGDHLKEVQFI
jgi:hypothetical protein